MQVEINEGKLIKLVNWLTNYPKIQRRLCDGEYDVTPEEFIEIMERLESNGFHELIVVLAFKNRYNDVLWQALCGLLMEKAGKEWERVGTEEMCREFKSKIREEMRRKEQHGGEF